MQLKVQPIVGLVWIRVADPNPGVWVGSGAEFCQSLDPDPVLLKGGIQSLIFSSLIFIINY